MNRYSAIRGFLCISAALTCGDFARGAEPGKTGSGAARNEPMVESVPMVRSWQPGEFPATLPPSVKFGKARVRIVVDEKGAIAAARVLDASQPELGEAALAAVKQWTFSPGVDDGKYAPMCLDVPFELSRDRAQKPGLLPPERLLPQLAPRKPAALIDGPLGDYPATLVGRGLPGTVLFTCKIDAEGKASFPRILGASHADFVLPALAAFPSWRFSPAMQGDLARPTELRGEVTYSDSRPPSRAKVLAANGITAPDGNPPEDSPMPVAMADPVWPYDLLLKGESGSASVEFTVGENGTIKDVRVHEASNPAFGSALLAAVQAWSFEPAMADGRRIAVALLAHADFKVPPADAADDPLARLLVLAKQNAIAGGRGLDAPLTPVYRVMPVLKSSDTEQKGAVEVEFVIDRDGRARMPRIVSASRDELGWAAATAINQWVFQPPMRAGKPTEVKVRLPMQF